VSASESPMRDRTDARRVPAHWLMKSEPDVYSIDDLKRDKRTFWDGVRNYAARNHMRAMKVGDLAFFYHSNAEPSGVAGVCRIAEPAKPDPTQFDPKDDHFDPKSPKDDPRWWAVTVEHKETFPRVVGLAEIKATPALRSMALLKQGRLSVTPVAAAEWKAIVALSRT